jgi:hypothetical protein
MPLAPLGTVHIAWPEDCSLTIPKLVKTEQGVIADTLEMTVVGRSFLLAIYRALGAVHVQDDSPMVCSSHGMVYPFSVQLPQSSQVLLGNKHFGLKSAQGISAGRLLL